MRRGALERISRDLRALRWWREVFAARFGPDGLPCEDQTLYGLRLVLCVRRPDGSLVEWPDVPGAHRHGGVNTRRTVKR